MKNLWTVFFVFPTISNVRHESSDASSIPVPSTSTSNVSSNYVFDDYRVLLVRHHSDGWKLSKEDWKKMRKQESTSKLGDKATWTDPCLRHEDICFSSEATIRKKRWLSENSREQADGKTHEIVKTPSNIYCLLGILTDNHSPRVLPFFFHSFQTLKICWLTSYCYAGIVIEIFPWVMIVLIKLW